MKKFFVIALGLLIGASTMHAAAFIAEFRGLITATGGTVPGTAVVGDTYTITVIANNDPLEDGNIFGPTELFGAADVVSINLQAGPESFSMETFGSSDFEVNGPAPGLSFADWDISALDTDNGFQLSLDVGGVNGQYAISFGNGYGFGPASFVSVRPIPEPSTLVAFGILGLAGFAFYRRRRTAADC